MKAEWKDEADIVLAGDSRVYRGLSPAAFSATFGQHCVNFGFSSAGYGEDYLDAVERVISTRARAPLIVLGVTPWSLTPRATRQNGFTDAMKESRESQIPALWRRRISLLEEPLRPFEVERLWYGARLATRYESRAADESYQQDFRTDGWVASDYLPHQPRRGLQTAQVDHQANPCSPEILLRLEIRVRQWTARGWRVAGFRPPSPSEVQILTDQLSGYREAEVARAFIDAGGEWISLPDAEFETYDGVHLTAAAASRFSELLAHAIKASSRREPARR